MKFGKNKKLSLKEYKNLNNFYWFFSLDLKSSKKTTQSVITKWINNNYKYNFQYIKSIKNNQIQQIVQTKKNTTKIKTKNSIRQNIISNKSCKARTQ